MLKEIANNILAKLNKVETAKNYISQIVFDDKNSNEQNVVFIAPNIHLARYIQTKYSETLSLNFESQAKIKPNIEILANTQIITNNNETAINFEQNQRKASLREDFTFDNFIVGDSNQYAFTVAKSVAADPGKNYNPLFIYGSTGLGKTHLLHSIGNHTINKNLNVICVNAEQFYNDFIMNVDNKTMQKFKDKYRNCNLLLIDDVQFLANIKSAKVQEEFFYTFNALKEKNSQIVLTSDKPPKLLQGFEERLISRFESGLTADITPPELDTKIRIIKAKCKFDGIFLTDEIINYIATNMGDNIREIEGALLNINAYARLMSQTITLEFTKNILKDLVKNKKSIVNLEDIINEVAKELNIKISEIKSKNKTKRIVEARRICIYLAKNLTPNSMPQLANHFGLKDHSAVSHNIKKINELMQIDENFKNQIEEIKNKIIKQK